MEAAVVISKIGVEKNSNYAVNIMGNLVNLQIL